MVIGFIAEGAKRLNQKDLYYLNGLVTILFGSKFWLSVQRLAAKDAGLLNCSKSVKFQDACAIATGLTI